MTSARKTFVDRWSRHFSTVLVLWIRNRQWNGLLVLPVRLSRASFVSCAAAVGGEKTAAALSVAAWQSKGNNKKGGNISGDGGCAASGSVHDLGTSAETATSSTKRRPDNSAGSGGVSGPGATGRTSAPDTCQEETSTMGVDGVVAELTRLAEVPERRVSAPLYFAFDHCFSVRGKGTILTGTVLTGVLKVSFEGGKERLTSQQYIVVFQGPCDLILQVLVLTVPVSNLFQAFATLPPCKRHYENRVVNAVVAAGASARRTANASVAEEGQIHADVPQAGLDRQVRVLV